MILAFAVVVSSLLAIPGGSDLPLDAANIVAELFGADVEIVADPTAKPVLRVSAADVGGAPVTPLESWIDGGALMVRRSVEAKGGDSARLRVQIVIGAEQELRLVGHDLSVVARETRYDGVTAPPGLNLDLEGSELDLEGGRDAVVEARDCSLFLSGTRGLLTLSLDAGSARVSGHEGDLKLTAADTEVALSDVHGKIEPALAGGSLDVRQGTGRMISRADDAVLLVEGWDGQFDLNGSGTTLNARDSVEPAPWKIAGDDLQVTLERIAGTLAARIEGGRLEAREMGSTLSILATHGADVDLAELTALTDLKIHEGARASLADASEIQVEVEDGQITADRIVKLRLNGTRAQVQASEVEKLPWLEMSDSDLDLDLGTMNQNASWTLSGAGWARVQLPTPCKVKVEGSRDLVGDQIDVSGCELDLPGQPGRSKHQHLIYGSRKPVILIVKLGEDYELEVEGSP